MYFIIFVCQFFALDVKVYLSIFVLFPLFLILPIFCNLIHPTRKLPSLFPAETNCLMFSFGLFLFPNLFYCSILSLHMLNPVSLSDPLCEVKFYISSSCIDYYICLFYIVFHPVLGIALEAQLPSSVLHDLFIDSLLKIHRDRLCGFSSYICVVCQ